MTTKLDGKAQEAAASLEAPRDGYLFDVFLSYSRKDEEFGKKLEEALESYRLPKGVKADFTTADRLRVFRDKNDLVLGGDYYKTIENYLKRSAYLVVVCSPNARRSEFVNKEIEVFAKSQAAERIIPVLLSGKPNNESAGDPEECAFPEALCRALEMPLAVSYTEFQQRGGRVSGGRYHDSWYTLLAKIFGAERAEIERVDAKRRARRRAALAAVSVAIIAALSVALVFALLSRREAERQRQEAVSQYNRARNLLYAFDMNVAQRAYESGNVGLGRGLLEAYRAAGQSGGEDLRGFEWYYLWRLYNGDLKTFAASEDVAFSGDGARFATAAADAVKVWDAATLRETASVELSPRPAAGGPGGDDYLYSAIDLSPDGRTVAYADALRGAMLIDTGSGASREVPLPSLAAEQRRGYLEDEESFRQFMGIMRGAAEGLSFSPDGRLLAVSYGCAFAAVYDAHSLRQIGVLGRGPSAGACNGSVTFSPDGRTLAFADGGVSLWDAVARRDLGGPEMDESLSDAIDQVEAVAFSPDGKILAIGDRSKQVVLWNVSTRKVLARLRGHDGWATALAFSHDGKTLYSGSMDQSIKLWDFSSYGGDGRVSAEKIKALVTLKGHTGYVRSISCSPAGTIVATAGADRTVKLWGEGAGRDFDAFDGYEAVSQNGAYLIDRYPNDEAPPRPTLLDIRGDKPVEIRAMEGIIAVSPDGRTLASYESDASTKLIKLWDGGSRQELASFQVRPDGNEPGAFSHDGRLFVTISVDGRSVLLWDAAGRRELPPVRGDAEVESYHLSADGKMLVTVDRESDKLRSWDVASQRQSAVFERKGTPGAGREGEEMGMAQKVLSPDGKLFAFSRWKVVELWATGTAQEPATLGKHEQGVTALAFSADGRLIASGDQAGVVKIWNAATRKEVSAYKAHYDGATALAFSRDGRALASGGGDGEVKLYGLASMRELLTLTHEPSPPSEVRANEGAEDQVLVLFFSEDGRSLITRSVNDVVRIWRGASEASVADRGQ